MLVLSRKIGEEIVMPDAGVTVTVVEIRGSRVKLGINAPPQIQIRRRELLDRECHSSQQTTPGEGNLLESA